MTGRPRQLRAAVVWVAVVVAATGCSGGSGAPLPPAPATVEVRMAEYRFDHESIPAGRVVFETVNHGQIVHRLSLVPLPEDLPPIDAQLRGDERRVISTLAAVADVQPGGSGAVAVDLVPGRYAFICFLTDSDGRSHALKGMATEFRIR